MTTPDPATLREALGDWTTDSPPPWQVKATVINAARWALDRIEAGKDAFTDDELIVVLVERGVLERFEIGGYTNSRSEFRHATKWQRIIHDSVTP